LATPTPSPTTYTPPLHAALPIFDLRGFDPLAPETGPGPTLGKALRRLGVDHHHLPGDVEDQADLYRTMLAGRRVLIVLDNAGGGDRKSTRLNSSHVKISYAVFCL